MNLSFVIHDIKHDCL